MRAGVVELCAMSEDAPSGETEGAADIDKKRLELSRISVTLHLNATSASTNRLPIETQPAQSHSINFNAQEWWHHSGSSASDPNRQGQIPDPGRPHYGAPLLQSIAVASGYIHRPVHLGQQFHESPKFSPEPAFGRRNPVLNRSEDGGNAVTRRRTSIIPPLYCRCPTSKDYIGHDIKISLRSQRHGLTCCALRCLGLCRDYGPIGSPTSPRSSTALRSHPRLPPASFHFSPPWTSTPPARAFRPPLPPIIQLSGFPRPAIRLQNTTRRNKRHGLWVTLYARPIPQSLILQV